MYRVRAIIEAKLNFSCLCPVGCLSCSLSVLNLRSGLKYPRNCMYIAMFKEDNVFKKSSPHTIILWVHKSYNPAICSSDIASIHNEILYNLNSHFVFVWEKTSFSNLVFKSWKTHQLLIYTTLWPQNITDAQWSLFSLKFRTWAWADKLGR